MKKMESIAKRLSDFVEAEMRSCSMDIAGITPEYVYRMWGGNVDFDDIEAAMNDKSLIEWISVKWNNCWQR